MLTEFPQTSWGNRPDGDINDNERMTPQVLPAEVMINPKAVLKGLVRYADEADAKIEKEKEKVEPWELVPKEEAK